MKKQIKLYAYLFTFLIIFFSKNSFALSPVGAKAVGMSGARIASVDDSKAYYYNPAAFGFFSYQAKEVIVIENTQEEYLGNSKIKPRASYDDRFKDPNFKENRDKTLVEKYGRSKYDNNNLERKDFGLGIIDFNLKFEVASATDKYLDLAKSFDDDFNSAKDAKSGSAEEVALMIRIANAVSKLNEIKDPILYGSANANVANIRIGHFGFSPNVTAYSYFWFDGLKFTATTDNNYKAEVDKAINEYLTKNPAAATYDRNTTTYTNTDASTTKAINDAIDTLAGIGATTTGLITNDDKTKNAIAYAANEELAKGKVKPEDITKALETLSGLSGSIPTIPSTLTAGNEVASLLSTTDDDKKLENMVEAKIIAKTFYVAEFPISYGYAINEQWSVGGNLKYMIGTDRKDMLQYKEGKTTTTKEDKQSTNFGVDLSTLYRIKMFNFGLVGRNLNSPQFNGVDGDKIKMEPELSGGIAFIPFSTFTLEVDYDFTEQKRYGGLKEKYASAGFELDLFRFLALRGGVSKNLSSPKGTTGITYSAGLGFNFWAIRLDIGAAVADDKIKITDSNGKEEKYPRAAQFGFNLECDF